MIEKWGYKILQGQAGWVTSEVRLDLFAQSKILSLTFVFKTKNIQVRGEPKNNDM